MSTAELLSQMASMQTIINDLTAALHASEIERRNLVALLRSRHLGGVAPQPTNHKSVQFPSDEVANGAAPMCRDLPVGYSTDLPTIPPALEQQAVRNNARLHRHAKRVDALREDRKARLVTQSI